MQHHPVQIVDFTEEPGFSGKSLKRPREEESRSQPSYPQEVTRHKRLSPKMLDTSRKSVWSSVAELGASGFEGSQRKQWEGGQLAALGAIVKGKSQRMPFKMYLGVTKAREKRAAKVEEEARQSGVVRPLKKKKSKDRKREDRAQDEPVPHNIRGAVMHVER